MEFIEEAGLIYDFVYGRIYKRQLKYKTYITCGYFNKTNGYHQIKIDGKIFLIHRLPELNDKLKILYCYKNK